MRLPTLVALASVASFACGKAGVTPPQQTEFHFGGTAAVRVSPGGSDQWLVLLETLQTQLLVTSPIRTASLVGADGREIRGYDAPDGWILVDAAAHPSGDVALLSVRLEPMAAYPLRVMISRVSPTGAVASAELFPLVPPDGPHVPPAFIASLDRARLVAFGEDLFAVVRWANNEVQAYRLGFDGRELRQQWATWVEPRAELFLLGIIGGGFDNFHQGDSVFFVYADVDSRGDLYVSVASTGEVLSSHDAFFGEDLSSQADPANFDFGTAVTTRIRADGTRAFARLFGIPGRNKRLLNLRVTEDSMVLVGRVKTGTEPGSWDAWILSAQTATGQLNYEHALDVQSGDMFWDVAGLGDGSLLAVGSTNYTQNPSGLSVSDARDALAVVLDSGGTIAGRIALPAGPAGRGNEAISVNVRGRDRIAISGVQNAPGTHAAVFSDAFLVETSLPAQ